MMECKRAAAIAALAVFMKNLPACGGWDPSAPCLRQDGVAMVPAFDSKTGETSLQAYPDPAEALARTAAWSSEAAQALVRPKVDGAKAGAQVLAEVQRGERDLGPVGNANRDEWRQENQRRDDNLRGLQDYNRRNGPMDLDKRDRDLKQLQDEIRRNSPIPPKK